MTYQIEYAYVCHIGRIRNNNEDNFWRCGETLPAQNQGMDHIRSGSVSQSELPLLAVFDGMGGESCGEMASFLAAKACGDFYIQNKKEIFDQPETFLEDACKAMNRERSAATAKKIRYEVWGRRLQCWCLPETGPMDAIWETAGFMRPKRTVCKVSKIMCLQVLFGKSPLLQYVGIPESSMPLEPSMAKLSPEPEKIFTLFRLVLQMLSDGEIADILTREITVQETVESILERLKKGGRDNATRILCEVREKKKTGFRKTDR